MAYNNTSYNSGYGQQSNPYDQPPAYGGQSYGAGYGREDNMEMQPLTTAAGEPYHPSGTPVPTRDPNAILNECREVGRNIDIVESRLPELQRKQRQLTSGGGASSQEIDALSADIMTQYRALGDRVRRIKGNPEAGNPRNRPQIEALDRRIRRSINSFQQTESQFRKEVQEQQRRQYQIVNPNATEEELQQVTESGADTQIFQQALLNADRRGQAQSTLRNVQQRQAALQQIERTLLELQQLFQDLDQMIVEQQPMVENIAAKTEETHEHIVASNVHIEKAVTSARAARKKKWICLGICILILIIIIVIVLAYGATQGWFTKKPAN